MTEQAEATRWLQRNDSRLAEIIRLLKLHYNPPSRKNNRSGLQVLVLTVLSQNTTDPNALQAYQSLLKKFPPENTAGNLNDNLPRDSQGNIDTVKIRMSMAADSLPEPNWKKIAKAEKKELEQAISVCGLQKTKAAAIQGVLNKLKNKSASSYNLEEWLKGLEPPEAVKKLEEIKGIGVKTAAVTLLEAFGADLCPVDTHVHRVFQRLRIVKENADRNKTFFRLTDLLPDGEGYALHHNLLTFGRRICTARNPDCKECFLQNICFDYRCIQNGEELTLKFI